MRKTPYIICLIILSFGCSKSEEPQPENPIAAELIFPFKNSLCNEGTNLTPTESTVLFEWKVAKNASSYTLVLKNIETLEETSYQSNSTELSLTIKRATQYHWYIISNSNIVAETAQSEIWTFYNAGNGVQNYAPFPAEIISPTMAETFNVTLSEITLDWDGSDVNNDIIGYDVYFGTTTSPEIHISNQENSELSNVALQSNTIYYWKIITKDSQGNSSDSGLYQFRNP